ncbi:hypothetical protein BVAVS116_K0026 (plasmid) [Borreliella valaisiana VS116]|uniref:Uncharacterized protein n=1 Tax=Borreliella valaisiana VS116 TaxID=445987 RepID=C0R8L9_BORVA|nr:hypothetical protein BVAVS116_K0026 [Borreliella valaisiana VS116]
MFLRYSLIFNSDFVYLGLIQFRQSLHFLSWFRSVLKHIFNCLHLI